MTQGHTYQNVSQPLKDGVVAGEANSGEQVPRLGQHKKVGDLKRLGQLEVVANRKADERRDNDPHKREHSQRAWPGA